MLRIGNASGFYGDRFSAFRELLDGPHLDVITGDYLAELTMLILGRDRLKDPDLGYAKTFLRQMQECAGLVAEKKTKIVVNAGGLNPSGLAQALRAFMQPLGLVVAHVEGDDLVARAEALGLGHPLTANAYLGGWGIAACLDAGAQVVVTGRVTDASLVVGAAAAHFKWQRDNWHALAGAMVAGHILECGTQASGGNFSFFKSIDLRHPGFPVAEIASDGSCVITKQPGSGGAVTRDTVTAQLLYEVQTARYAGPDATVRLDSIALADEGADRVRVSGVRGEPPPPTYKVCLNHLGGFRNQAIFFLVGLDIEEKAKLLREQFEAGLTRRPQHLDWSLVRSDREDAATQEEATASLRVMAKDPDAKVVGRAFSALGVELALGTYPGFFMTAPPGDGVPYGVYTAAYVDAREVPHTAVLADGTRLEIAPSVQTLALAQIDPPALPTPLPEGPTERTALGRLAATRSGDKGGSANVGVWVQSEEAWRWLAHTLTVDKLQALLPETAAHPVKRHLLPQLRGMNFVIEGLLGEGVASSSRFDAQAKALGEWLRSRHLDIPLSLLLSAGFR